MPEPVDWPQPEACHEVAVSRHATVRICPHGPADVFGFQALLLCESRATAAGPGTPVERLLTAHDLYRRNRHRPLGDIPPSRLPTDLVRVAVAYGDRLAGTSLDTLVWGLAPAVLVDVRDVLWGEAAAVLGLWVSPRPPPGSVR